MDRLKNSLIGIASLLALIGLIAVVTPTDSRGQGGNSIKPPQDVNVVNTPDNSVPVVTQGNNQRRGKR